MLLKSEHPDDERLSAFASGETDATGDSTLAAHVTSCDRCAELVRDLTSLRAALSELPDMAPARRLRLVPPVEADAPAAVDRLGGWVSRLFGPALALGGTLAFVGLVGTTLPAFQQAQSSGGADSAALREETAEDAGAAPGAAELFVTSEPTAQEPDEAPADAGAGTGEAGEGTTLEADEQPDRATDIAAELPIAERSPWPMVLFTGVALIVAAALLRWIVVPRAG